MQEVYWRVAYFHIWSGWRLSAREVVVLRHSLRRVCAGSARRGGAGTETLVARGARPGGRGGFQRGREVRYDVTSCSGLYGAEREEALLVGGGETAARYLEGRLAYRSTRPDLYNNIHKSSS